MMELAWKFDIAGVITNEMLIEHINKNRILPQNALLNGKIRMDATITEMIFVPHTVSDGSYLLNLQIASFENDASPSKPVLYAFED